MSKVISTGGCHCGSIRYEVYGAPVWKMMCFCKSCTRTVGAPVVAWAGFRKSDFKIVQGTLRKYQSSGKADLGFCSRCGFSLTYEKRKDYAETRRGGSVPEEIYISVMSFDDPMAYPPDDYAYFEEKVEWLHPGEDLPRHEYSSVS